MSPPLVSMLQDPLLQERYLKHITGLVELAEKEIVRLQERPAAAQAREDVPRALHETPAHLRRGVRSRSHAGLPRVP